MAYGDDKMQTETVWEVVWNFPQKYFMDFMFHTKYSKAVKKNKKKQFRLLLTFLQSEPHYATMLVKFIHLKKQFHLWKLLAKI